MVWTEKFITALYFFLCAGENLVSESEDEAQKAIKENAGGAEDTRGLGQISGERQRQRSARQKRRRRKRRNESGQIHS